jgi:hypothetical protein
MKPSIMAKDLFPNYKPSTGKIIQQDILEGWDVMISAYPSEVSAIDPSASDDQLLDFAEAASDNQLTLSVISYVETTIEMDGCDIIYQERLLKAERHRIEKEIYENHQRRARRCRKYIREIESRRFPIDAERLINNYFKTSQRDADGAYQVLITNPATYSPIEVEKIKPRFFGLIKPKPQDGFRINKLIGNFLKRLRA